MAVLRGEENDRRDEEGNRGRRNEPNSERKRECKCFIEAASALEWRAILVCR